MALIEADITGVMDRFRRLEQQPRGPSNNPFTLRCTVAAAATDDEVSSAWGTIVLPPQVRELWLSTREARLFEDVMHGQWGLSILSPSVARALTAKWQATRSQDVEQSDVVIGEFLGDSELLVVTSAGDVLVALPLDSRADWPRPAPSLAQFLDRYRESVGDKYWEETS